MSSPPPTSPPNTSAAIPPVVANGAITFFYYHDMRAALEFYEHIVGLKRVADLGWCALLALQPRSFLGLVDAAVGSQRPIGHQNPPGRRGRSSHSTS